MESKIVLNEKASIEIEVSFNIIEIRHKDGNDKNSINFVASEIGDVVKTLSKALVPGNTTTYSYQDWTDAEIGLKVIDAETFSLFTNENVFHDGENCHIEMTISRNLATALIFLIAASF